MKKFLNRFKNGNNDALVESIIAGYELIFESHSARDMYYPTRGKVRIESDRDKLMYGINSAFKKLSPKNKERFMKNYVPRGIEIAIYSLSTLDNNTLIHMKENLMDIRNEEKDYDESLKREAQYAKAKKIYERNMDKVEEDQKIDDEYQKAQGRKERQELLNWKIDSGEINEDELKRMREDGEIDSSNRYIYYDELDKTLLGKAEKRLRRAESKGSKLGGGFADIVKGVSDIKNAVTQKKD